MALIDLELSSGENIILEDGNIGWNRKLVLTNKRLVFLQGKGVFKKTFSVESEIPLDTIQEACMHSDTCISTSDLTQASLKETAQPL